jgi:hypothetical protein
MIDGKLLRYLHPPTCPQGAHTRCVQSFAVFPSNKYATSTFPLSYVPIFTNEVTKALLRSHGHMYGRFTHHILIHHLSDLNWQVRKEHALSLRMRARVHFVIGLGGQTDRRLALTERHVG